MHSTLPSSYSFQFAQSGEKCLIEGFVVFGLSHTSHKATIKRVFSKLLKIIVSSPAKKKKSFIPQNGEKSIQAMRFVLNYRRNKRCLYGKERIV